MPELINRNKIYDNDAGIGEGLRSLGQVMAQLPAVRARGALMNAQRGRFDALANEASAHADLFKQQGLKTEDERNAAADIAATFNTPGAITQDSMGNVVISAPAFQRILGNIARTGHGANDTAGGLGKMITTQNAPVQEEANRKNKIAVAEVKPIILNPGQTAVSNNPADVSATDPDSGDPISPAARIIASVPKPETPVKPLPDYTITTIDDIKNPAYDPAQGMTNAPPMIKKTNIVSRVSGKVSPSVVANAPQIPKTHADYLLAHPDTAAQFDQKYGQGSAAAILKRAKP